MEAANWEESLLRASEDRMSGLLIPLGTALFLFGLGLLSWTVLVGAIYVSICGLLIAASGLIVACGALFGSQRELFWMNMYRGCLFGVVGFMIASKPGPAEGAMGLIVAAVLLVEGILELASFAVLKSRRRIGRILVGAYSFGMGLLIWSSWPESGYQLICLGVAIDMVMNGLGLVSAGVSESSQSSSIWSSLIGNVAGIGIGDGDGGLPAGEAFNEQAARQPSRQQGPHLDQGGSGQASSGQANAQIRGSNHAA